MNRLDFIHNFDFGAQKSPVDFFVNRRAEGKRNVRAACVKHSTSVEKY